MSIKNNKMEVVEEVKGSKWKCENCDKSYANSGGLWKHKQKCGIKKVAEVDLLNFEIELLKQAKDNEIELLKQAKDNEIELLKQAKDNEIELLKQQVLMLSNQLENQNALLKQSLETSRMIDASHNKTIKNTFNIQVYLNETCKDAINMNTLINNFKLDDFSVYEKFIIPPRIDEKVNKTTQLASVLLNELAKYEKHKRPIQTSDKSRLKFYYKLDDKWIFCDDDLEKFNKQINSFEMELFQNFRKLTKSLLEGRDRNHPLHEIRDKITVGLYAEYDKDKLKTCVIPSCCIDKK